MTVASSRSETRTELPEILRWPFPSGPHGTAPPLYATLREQRPVARVELPSGGWAWMLTRRADITLVGSDRRFSRNLTHGDGVRIAGDDFNAVPGGIFNLDPPDHTRVRRIVQRFFNPEAARRLRPTIAGRAHGLIDAMDSGINPADLYPAYATPLALHLACDMMSVSMEQRRKIIPDLHDQVDFARDSALIATSTRNILEFAAEVIEAKRAEWAGADNDPISALIDARNRDEISEQELHGTVMYLFVTSAEPVLGPVVVGVYTLTRYHNQLDQLLTRASDELWDTAVWELVRYHHNGLISLPRMAVEDVVLHGVTIKAGDAVLTPWVAATWDPAHYHKPDRFWIFRAPEEDPAITFGTGPHFCLGANIARTYLHTALRTLFERLPELAVAVKHADIAWEPDHFIFTRPIELPVTW